MPLRPLLNLNQIAIDTALIGRIPFGIAMYYLALPLAYEEDRASVVMAHPENGTGLARLREILGMDLVPVRGHPQAIRAMLEQFYSAQDLPQSKILAWSAHPSGIAGVAELAHLFGDATGKDVSILSAPEADLEMLLATAYHEHCSLMVVRPAEGMPSELFSRASSPILLARNDKRPLRRILMVMRGYSSDEHALDWVIPLIRHTGAEITLMPILQAPYSQFQQMLNSNGVWREHIQGCLRHISANKIHARLKLREGEPVQQIAQEMEEEDYDLLVLTAEGYGQFVRNVLNGVDRSSHNAQCSVLVMKPTCT
ncbi:MAG: universal stress protein [Caldilineaceae bacterium]|nr:universal stress protein [Caldilineaceae bacterium]